MELRILKLVEVMSDRLEWNRWGGDL